MTETEEEHQKERKVVNLSDFSKFMKQQFKSDTFDKTLKPLTVQKISGVQSRGTGSIKESDSEYDISSEVYINIYIGIYRMLYV